MSHLLFDDRHPAVQYSSQWVQGGIPPEFRSTTRGTNVDGQTAVFTFTGTRVSVHGTIPRRNTSATGGPLSSYVIDGGPPILFEADTMDRVQYNQRFFNSPVLPNTTHELTITKVGTDGELWLDYFLVELADDLQPQVVTVGNRQTTTVTQTITGSAANPTGAQAGQGGQIQGENAGTGTNTAAIVGGVLGGLAGLALVAIGLFLFLRRTRKRQRPPSAMLFNGAYLPSRPVSIRSIPITPYNAYPTRDSRQPYPF
ncbi:hypothetical protein CC2G_015184 [Coprinopsis cinerea AmutBmut pab1-1]|nr:hypothetical protein CC2G_015184 [Coprinopsis cinerea AmutBmut pab1-1]